MKSMAWLWSACIVALLCANVRAIDQPDEEDELTPPPQEREFASAGEAMGFGLGRGFANLTLGAIEIPRNFLYEFTRRPLSAVITAPMMGATLTAARAVYGAIDVLSLGLNGYYEYAAAIPDYPWESPWVATETQME
jgi:hypothetical protein